MYNCQLWNTISVIVLVSSPEPSGSQGELIVYPCSGVRPFTISNISSETAWPIKAKIYVEPPCPWEGGTKVYISGPGHMTKVKTFKNLLQNQKSCYLETWHVASGTQVLQSLYKR